MVRGRFDFVETSPKRSAISFFSVENPVISGKCKSAQRVNETHYEKIFCLKLLWSSPKTYKEPIWAKIRFAKVH